MSHLKERTEKNCLNCGTSVTGRYCQHCGQENVEVKESFGHLIMHFVEDITHFDGKLWVTLKLLLFKPAKLTQHYMDGKRATYIHPIRMYLFVSAVFFFFIFSGKSSEEFKGLEKNNIKKSELNKSKSEEAFNINLGDTTIQYNSIAAYDSAQSKLPPSKRANWIESSIVKKSIDINKKYKEDNSKIGEALIEQFQHYFSRILYISLPLFAFFLWILYRRNKNHYFVDHLIFSLHIYCAFFIILFGLKLVDLFTVLVFHKTYGIAVVVTAIALLYYLYKALKNHFRQSRKKTILKFIILNILTIFLMSLLMIGFFLLSLFNI
jgi:hypothetical protein